MNHICSHFPACGGCKAQHIPYEEQLATKESAVREIFAGHIAPLYPIIAAPSPWHYRNKMEFSFGQLKEGTRLLGLILKGSRGKVFPLTECPISPPWFSKAVGAVHRWWQESSLCAYHPPTDRGSLRTLTLREGKNTGAKLAMLTISGNPAYPVSRNDLEGFAAAIRQIDPAASIFVRIQQLIKKEPSQFYELHLSGPPTLRETIEVLPGRPLQIEISPTTFFQPNTATAEKLYARALELAASPAGSLAYDLYCGAGAIGLCLAQQGIEVRAIEINPYAVYDAEANRTLNQLDHLTITCGDVGQLLAQWGHEREPPPHLAVIDPPRVGLGPIALRHLLALQSQKILYISCNPTTQSSDITQLCLGGYRLTALQPIDQFPHTPHIENIALLERS